MANGGVSPFGCTEEEKVCCQAIGKGFQPKVKSVLVDLSVLGVFFLVFCHMAHTPVSPVGSMEEEKVCC